MVGRMRKLCLFKSFRIDFIKKDRQAGWLIHNLDWPGLMTCTDEITEKSQVPTRRI